MSTNVIYKRLTPDEHVGEGLTRELNVTGYVDKHAFPLRYIKTVHPLNPRDSSIDSAFQALRSIDNKTSGTLIEYLFEACLMKVYDLDYHLEEIVERKELKDYFHGDKTTMLNTIFEMLQPGFVSDEEGIAIWTLYRTLDHVYGFTNSATSVLTMIHNPAIETIRDYFIHDLIPQLNIQESISFEPAYLTVREHYALRSGPDFIIDGKIVDMKVAERKTVKWGRQLYLYEKGLEQNHIPHEKSFILNPLANEMVEYMFQE